MKKYIKISKNFSVEAAALFREEVNGLVSNNVVDFEIDFSECDFIDSTGLGILVGLLKKCNNNGSSIVLCNMKKDVFDIFEMTRLTHVFTIK